MARDSTIKSYRDLRVWQDSMALAAECYRLSRSLPKEEMFGLTVQIRRSAASIPANIAEGHGRENTQSFIQYLRIAQGSLKELETHWLLATRVGLVREEGVEQIIRNCESLGKMLRLPIRSLQQNVKSR